MVVSHDNVWCWKGSPWPVALRDRVAKRYVATHFDTVITPMLSDSGVSDETIHRFTHDNPRRFFEGERPGH